MIAVLVASLAVAMEPASCARAEALLALDRARPRPVDGAVAVDEAADRARFARYAELLGLVPASHPILVDDVRRLAGRHGTLDDAFAALAHLFARACARPSVVDGADHRARAAAILADPIFAGERERDDALDRLIARARAWLFSLLESEGMQRYAGVSRFLYLVVVTLAATAFAIRLLRERRRRTRRAHDDDARALTAARVARARSHLARARAHVTRGERHAALLEAELALTGALVERGDDAGPARTHDEILRGLDPTMRAAVAPRFAAQDRALFAGDLDVDVGALLDDLEVTLGELGGAP